MSAGVAWTPPRGSAEAISKGARLYATECASCHGTQLGGEAIEGQVMPKRTKARRTWTIPPLGGTGHAWRHSDAELAAIVARGTKDVARPDGTPDMPAFAERLGRDEIGAILAYLKSRWPANVRAYQAALNLDGGVALATLPRDPAWTFPNQCLSPPAATDRP